MVKLHDFDLRFGFSSLLSGCEKIWPAFERIVIVFWPTIYFLNVCIALTSNSCQILQITCLSGAQII